MNRHCRRTTDKTAGFTFIELVVVIAIMLILAGMAVPSLQGSIARGRVQAAALQLAQDLRLVRENTITYQADLDAYFSTDAGANGSYYYEQLPHLGSNGLPDDQHDVPPADGGALPDPGRFVRKLLPFNMQILSATSSAGSIVHNGHQYYEVHFRSGTSTNVVPGSVETPVTVVVGSPGGRAWKVVIDAVGRTHIQQQ